MASSERKNSKPALGRRNTFQRMLDLEQKNKVNRMQASSTFPLANTSTTPGPPPRSNLRQHPPVPLQLIGRAMTNPALSLSIPLPKPSSNGTSTKYVIMQSGEVIPQEEEVSEDGSDVSSICQSPSWEDYNGKKRRKVKEEEKERRRREKEGTGPLVQQVKKSESPNRQSPHRLSKTPPTNKRLTKMAITTDRFASAPAVPTFPDMAKSEAAKEVKKNVPDKVRRGSIEIGLKGFISATHAIPVPWKSSQNSSSSTTPTQQAPSRKSFSRAPGSFTDEGFIGGLKLEQRIIRDQKVGGGNDVYGLLHNDMDSTPGKAGNLSSSTSMAESVQPPTSIYEESIRTPQQWDAVYAQAAASACALDSPPQPVEDKTPIMERNIRKTRRSHPPTSRYFPMENEDSGSPQHDSPNENSRRSFSNSRGTEDKTSQGRVQSSTASPVSPDPPPANDQGTAFGKSELSETRGRPSYVRHQRQESEDKAATALQDEQQIQGATASKKTKPSRSSFVSFARSRSRVRNPSQETPSTGRSGTRENSVGASAKKASNDTSLFLNEEDVLKQLHLELSTKTSQGTSNHTRSSSKSGFKGLKSAARAAFSRHSIAAPESPSSESFATAVEFQCPSSKAPSSKRASIDVVSTSGSSRSKADRFLPDLSSPPIVHDFAVSPLVPNRSPERKDKSIEKASPLVPNRSPERKDKSIEKAPRRFTPKAINGSNGKSNHSRSATDSSEGYSTLDELSNLTTPMASRPNSQKDHFAVKIDLNTADAVGNKSTPTLNGTPNGTPLMSGAIPFDDAASARDSWCRTAVELELTEDEDRMKTPTGKKSIPDFTTVHPNKSTAQAPPPVPQMPLKLPHVADLQRNPSLSRSMSTPEMQDLSFLPALKHQALTRPPKGKGKVASSKKSKSGSKSPSPEEQRPAKATIRPAPIPIPTTKSEGSSPTSPQSSQYLQNARLAIPRAPRSPKTTFPPGPHHQNGPDPIAKMFVICCSCKYFHDMPSKIYQCMVKPDNVVTDNDLGVSGVISTSVKCPWCGHGMSTACCAGYAAVVYLQERMH